MLVLTRRKDQKVLFPNLGIAVEVIDISGRQVRLGIDAPQQVRVLRDELMSTDEPLLSFVDDVQTKQHIDAVNLAIHLAPNQFRQGLPELATQALEEALENLNALERILNPPNPLSAMSDLSVHESHARYTADTANHVLVFQSLNKQRRSVVSI